MDDRYPDSSLSSIDPNCSIHIHLEAECSVDHRLSAGYITEFSGFGRLLVIWRVSENGRRNIVRSGKTTLLVDTESLAINKAKQNTACVIGLLVI